ncbi:MAG: hypothetical protein JSV63_01420 [Candidatus Aenigmatarchaeota archaeon]|nr:MAG: hypothetical protein JSV63_01420 [Candidatus Aenigmarchaeota archaeon]
MLKEFLLGTFVIISLPLLIIYFSSLNLPAFVSLFLIIVAVPPFYVYRKYGWLEGIMTFILDLAFSYLILLLFLIYLNICCI